MPINLFFHECEDDNGEIFITIGFNGWKCPDKSMLKQMLSAMKELNKKDQEWIDFYNYQQELEMERIRTERIENNKTKKQAPIPVKGYIYLLKSIKLHKIGRALKLDSRIKQYKTENPHEAELIVAVEADDYVKAEKYLLDKYSKYQVRGEWFKLNKIQAEKLKKDIEQKIWITN